ncbi:MAG: Na/Pi symporter [Tunicatimonas sp.]|uniref:Na/Pi symporter n=1 Tax=Tunicatimonas sp. TaxID=1940096 RepID=UPI003C77F60C
MSKEVSKVSVLEQRHTVSQWQSVGKYLSVLGAIIVFMLSINLLSYSFQGLREEIASLILSVTMNPFIGLFIGLLLTAVIQSSSISTSMVVALVGSGTISLSAAVPLIMGANVGTTLTSTIISLSFITHRRAFRKAISAGVVHDIYNIMLVILLFPLEYYYQGLSRTSIWLVNTLGIADPEATSELVYLGSFSANGIDESFVNVVGSHWLVLVLACSMLFFSIKYISNVISKSLIGESKDKLKKYIFTNPYKSFLWGGGLTAAVQSSSITTSLIIPLVATNKVSLAKSFPFIIGANIGTTITALIASFFATEVAVSIAIVHLLFNSLGVLLFLPIASIRRIPIGVAALFGRLTLRHRLYGFLYIVLMFFIIPFLLIYFNQ